MTDLEIYQPPAQPEQYQARMAMTQEQAKALDDQVRLCTRAVLRDGVDYGTIPGAGDRKVLLQAGAEKLLQWFGFGFTCDRTDLEIDEDGQKQGVTYRCTVTKQLPDGRVVAVTTCEGYAGYDEAKFYKPVTDAERHKAEARERGWAAKDKRVADPTKWKNLSAYRAPWNTILKMAQKRAIVGAAITATAAAGLFGQEEDNSSPVADDGSTWTEQALEAVWVLTDTAELDNLYVAALHAARDGLCSRKQKDWVQNAVRKRQEQLKTARPVDVEDLAKAAQDAAEDETAEPGSDRHRKLISQVQAHFKRLGFSDDDRAERLWAAGKLAGVADPGSLNDLEPGELSKVAAALAKCKDRQRLEELLADPEATA